MTHPTAHLNINNRHQILLLRFYGFQHILRLTFPIHIRTIEMVTPHTNPRLTRLYNIFAIHTVYQGFTLSGFHVRITNFSATRYCLPIDYPLITAHIYPF